MRKKTMKKTLFGIVAAAVMLLGMGTAVFAGSIAEDVLEDAPALAAYVPMPSDFRQTGATATSVTLSWSSVADAQYYLVGFGQDRDSAVTETTSNTSITFTGLAKNTIYKASIAAIAADGSYSSAVPDIICRTLPTAPSLKGKESSQSGSSLTLYFKTSDSEAVQGYQIKYTNLKTKKTKTASTSTGSITLPLNGKSFYKAVLSGYITVDGKTLYGAKKTTYLACQPVPKAKLYGNGAKITWPKVKGATNYSVYVSSSPDSGYKKKATTKSASYILSNMTKWKYYYVYIKANRKVGGKTYSSPFTFYNRMYRY